MLLAQVVHTNLMEGLELVVLELNCGRQVPPLDLLHLILVDLHHIEFLGHDEEGRWRRERERDIITVDPSNKVS